jgi:hypothetical protein
LSQGDREHFLARWSRRKLEAPADAPAVSAPPGTALDPAQGAQPVESPPLPGLDSLDGLASDYRGFMRAGVDDGLRRDALKKLFTDPHFNKMDGLDVYIEDYSIESPIPDAMLCGLNQARSLFLLEEKRDAVPGGPQPPAVERPPASEALPGAEAIAPVAAAGADPDSPAGVAASLQPQAGSPKD